MLVLAAPAAAGVLVDSSAVLRVALAFVAFSLAASGTYLINDAVDVAVDRRHPVKRLRPVAAGSVSRVLASVTGLALLAAALVVAGALVGRSLLAVVAAYVATTTAYSLWLKRIAVVDIVVVAAGFVLRAVGGAAAAGVPVSRWFFVVASLGSLFMVAGKREAELRQLAGLAGRVRPTLNAYTVEFLGTVRATASGAAIVAYCLWAFEKDAAAGGAIPWAAISFVPFLVGVLRYALLVAKGHGAEPVELVMRDRPLLMSGLVLTVLVAASTYGG
ncbi:MAG: decaprenyl-phosphate phosphoribosyltransferase [Actinomycetota bacterium]|nr:decaprenyl-phosphate phosphoribosyltransferase [Actinomycetota bacterium]